MDGAPIVKKASRCSIQLQLEENTKPKLSQRTSVRVKHDLFVQTDRSPQMLNPTLLSSPRTVKQVRTKLVDGIKLSRGSLQSPVTPHRKIIIPGMKQEQVRTLLEPIKTNFIPRRKSQVPQEKQEEFIDEQQPRSAGILPIKNKHILGLSDSPIKLNDSKPLSSFGSFGNFGPPKISHPLKNIEKLQMNFASNGYIDSPKSTRSSNRRESSIHNLNSPDAVILSKPMIGSNLFESPSSRRTEEPSLIPVGSDYLLKVIFNKNGGSNGGSSAGSPMNVGTPDNLHSHQVILF